ncbi:MAG: CPBP family intramembrane metalloprotease [Candidatus Marinimicrobia bacterium]|nr:CPBP family intramembrane metalloprotease [Candidatus Neomarinimicrobiota bacterium]
MTQTSEDTYRSTFRSTSYWHLSRSPFYSFVFTLPFFALYEIATLTLNEDQLFHIRNGADVLLRQFFAIFGDWGIHALNIVFIVGFVVSFLLQKSRRQMTTVRGAYLMQMLTEGLLWGGVLYVFMKVAPTLLSFPSGRSLIQQMTLAVGAGLYEEFLFRVVAIFLLVTIIGAILKWERRWCTFAAVIISALLFASFHYIGDFGETFILRTFLLRAFAGLFLGTVYVFRGFGITALAHMSYDFIVVSIITTT